jgi:hypothetical protein
MDIILSKILIIALVKYPKDIISIALKKFIRSVIIVVKHALVKMKEINIIAFYVKIIICYIIPIV